MIEQIFKPVVTSQGVAQPDPYIFKDGGKYYIYATGNEGISVFSSDTLNNFEYNGFALKTSGQKEFWAPCVYKFDSKFYMYYSSMITPSDDVHTQQIRLAVGSSPLAFKYECDLVAPFSIDPHVVRNALGKLYMFYSDNSLEEKRVGTRIVCSEMKSIRELTGSPRRALTATIDEEIFMKNRFREGEHWHTLEGAFYFYYDGYHYLTYSGNCYENENYYIGYASSRGEINENLNEIEWEKQPDENTYLPLMKSRGNIEGTGHNSILVENGEIYIVFHARIKSDKKQAEESRVAFIEKLVAKKGKLSLAKK